MIPPPIWRIGAAVFLVLLFGVKFFAFGPIKQIELVDITSRTASLLAAKTSGSIEHIRQPRRIELQQFTFHLDDCPAPYVALQALVMEDPQAVIDAAAPLPVGLIPHIILLGEELDFDDRLGVKLTAIKKFVTYRLGLSPEQPTAYLYIVMAAPSCNGYKNLDWWRAWAA
ncbi:MAG: hypothetical protein KGO94_05115 [Alphaproteobacteria bacterium]|nr:hypothetical protein [Alphaproteobacteria bacterium]